ncbi:hypothetical protein Trydic_g2472 [Trypoxylus dichotomus]
MRSGESSYNNSASCCDYADLEACWPEIRTCVKQTKDAIKQSSIPKEEQRRVLPSESRPPRLYGLPKIHKPGNPLRPILSAYGSPTELIKYVAKQLAQYTGNTKSFVKDSENFIKILQQHEITNEDLLVSFDVESLFTNLPVEETLEIIKQPYQKDYSRI